jgi:cation diffusion facilitator CzcD-associated flavoprotein CzcO
MEDVDVVVIGSGQAGLSASHELTGVAVTSLRPRPGDGFALGTDDGALQARAVVVATGAYQRAHRPPWVGDLPAGLLVLDSTAYRNPGAVVMVGSGQTGCQLAEELVMAGRCVVLSWWRRASQSALSLPDLPGSARRIDAVSALTSAIRPNG